MEVFYEHDSDDRLIARKDALELSNWIVHLVNNGVELEILINIAKKLSNNNDMVGSLNALAMENKLHIGVFYRYKSSMVNIHECEDMACDLYYMNKHEEFRKLYGTILEASHKLKEELYTQILVKL
jgi:predicted NUDIX family phosphoesterase